MRTSTNDHKPASLRARVCGVAVSVTVLVACSGSQSSSDPSTSAPYATATSSSGLLVASVSFSPQPPSSGLLECEMKITKKSDGSPVDGLTLEVSPWMPMMKHGASVVPTVMAQGGGQYLVGDLYLAMAGLWELRTSISGPMTDTVDPEFQVQ